MCVSCVPCSGPQVWWGYNIVILRHTETLINIIYSVWSLISVSTTSYRQHYTPCLSCYWLFMLPSGCGEQLNVKFLLWMFSTKYEKIAERFHKNKIGYNLCTHLLCVWLTIAAAKARRLLLTMVSWTLLAFLIYHSPLSQTWEIKIAVNKNCDLIRHKTPEWRQMGG